MSGPTADDSKAGTSPPGSKDRKSLNDGRRAYRCSTCHRDFKRSEHCSRHERIHTREKPFECKFCHKRYARKDLVTRHVRTLHPLENNKTDDASPSPRRASDAVGLVSALSDKTTPQTRRRATLAGDRNTDLFFPDATALEQTPPQSRRRPGLRDDRNDFSSATAFGDFQLSQPVQDPPQSVSSATGNPAGVLYPSPQSCPDQAYGIGPHAADLRAETKEIPFCDVDFPIDPQLFEANDATNIGLQLDRAASDTSFLNFDMSNDRSDETPSSKRRKVNAPQPDAKAPQPESDYNTIDIFRDFWSDPCAPSRTAHAGMPAEMTPESLDFAGHIDPFFTQSLDLPTPIQTLYGSLGSDFFLGAMPPSQSHSLPFGQQETSTKLPEIKVTDHVFRRLHEDFLTRARETFSGSHGFPDQSELQKFIECYISCFHRHLPLIHLASMKLEATPSPLVLAICCIGALYRLERRRAEALCDLATTQIEVVISESRSCGSLKPAPLWAVQGMLLLSMYGIYSGRSAPTMDTIERMGFLANDYRLRRLNLADSSGDNDQWEAWINREAAKRLLCSVFLLSTIISIMFGSNPSIAVNEDLEFEIPEGEDAWAAQTEQQWQDVRSLVNRSPRRTMRDAIMDAGPNTEGQDEPDVLEPIPGFAKLVMMHAANVHVWTQQQVSQAFGQTIEYQAISSVIHSKSARILEKCAHSLASPARHHVRAEDHRDTLNKDAEASLVFNSEACLRLAHLRLLSNDYKLSFDRLTVLVSDEPDKVSSALDAYVASPQQGGIEAATKAYEGFLVPVRVGHLLVRKTAAFNWSVEQAIAFWDCAMFLTKWVHWAETKAASSNSPAEMVEGGCKNAGSSGESDSSLEQSQTEQLLDKCSNLLREMESEHQGRRNLAGALARSGALFLDDTWVWGVTPRMGKVLTQLADVYGRS